MPKLKLQANLSKQSINNLIKEIKVYGNNIEKGISLGIEEATKNLYDLICAKMKTCNLEDHIGNIVYSYDKKEKIGKVKTNDIVIIFHEFGTGIKSTQDEWASYFDYQVNQSGKGQSGWFFENETYGYSGITHGLTAKHIFYESLLEIQKQLSKTISISVFKTTGAMY